MASYVRNKLRSIKYAVRSLGIRFSSEGRVAVIGCARSGTTYTSRLMTQFGFDVRHEQLGKHGICSWCIVPDTASRIMGPAARNLSLARLPVVHQVREPLKAISSCTALSQKSWEWIAKYTSVRDCDSKLLRSMKYWLEWNEIAEGRAVFSYQLENIDEALPLIFDVAGFDYPVESSLGSESVAKNVNTRKHVGFDWADLREEDGRLAQKIKEMGARYGYYP